MLIMEALFVGTKAVLFLLNMYSILKAFSGHWSVNMVSARHKLGRLANQ